MSIRNVLIVGLGEMGIYLARRLMQDGCHVTAIESDPQQVEYARENLGRISVIEGHAMQMSCWRLVHVDRIDLLIALTGEDTINMTASLMADRFSIPLKIVRVRYMELEHEGAPVSRSDFRIDLVIHPEEAIARHVARIVRRSAANDVLDVGDGRMQILAVHIGQQSPLIGLQLRDLAERYSTFNFRVVVIVRGITTIISGDSVSIQPFDQVFIMTRDDEMETLMALADIQQAPIHRLMILGGSLVGARVAQLLESTVDVTLVERDAAHAGRLQEVLEGVRVLHGDGTEASVLVETGIEETETFFASTGNDETNIVSSLLAKEMMSKDDRKGSAKAIGLVRNETYLELSESVGLDAAFNVKILAADEILQFIRRSEYVSLTHLNGADAEVVELVAASGSRIVEEPLSAIRPELERLNIVVGGVFQEGEWHCPRNGTRINPGDHLHVICMSQGLKHVEELFR